jgi:hypothetical protein
MRTFQSLSEQETLALAISLEEEDARIYDDFAEGLRDDYPATAETPYGQISPPNRNCSSNRDLRIFTVGVRALVLAAESSAPKIRRSVDGHF